MISRESAVLPFTPAADHTGMEGYFAEMSGSNIAVCNSAADIPIGVITEGFTTTGKTSVALPAFHGLVKVKLGPTPGAVVTGSYLVLNADGTSKLDPGTGARVRVARACEAGAANELIEAYLVEPTALT